MGTTLLKRTPHWISFAAFVVLGTMIAVGLSFVFHYLLFFGDDINPYQRSLAAALMLPIIIASPLLLYIGYNAETLRRFKRERNFAAAHDPSTEVLNGSAFTTLVERRRSSSISEAGRTYGALLILEAENARTINLDYGFRWGEESMRQIASMIRANIRRSDIVGRLSDREFGIFLPGATVEQAREVGERIRTAAATAPFLAEGEPVQLTLDIGGVIFDDQIEFQGLMRVASKQLDMARAKGADGFRLGTLQGLEAGEASKERTEH